MNAYHMVSTLEDREAKRLGVSVLDARAKIADRLKIAPGSLENIRRQRVTSPRATLLDKIRNLFIAELTAEIRRLEHEILLATRGGLDIDSTEMVAAQAHLEAAKKLIGERK